MQAKVIWDQHFNFLLYSPMCSHYTSIFQNGLDDLPIMNVTKHSLAKEEVIELVERV